MSLLQQLSSEVGDKTEESNRKVVLVCLENPSYLQEIAVGLKSHKAALIGDAAEVMTKVAEVNPALVAPYVHDLIPLLSHKTTRVRWEAMHAIALITNLVPDVIIPLLPQVQELVYSDTSAIVRDYAIDSLGQLVIVGEQEAVTAFPVLKEALTLWEGKHKARVLRALLPILTFQTEYDLEIRRIAEEHVNDNRGTVQKAAKALIKAIDKGKI